MNYENKIKHDWYISINLRHPRGKIRRTRIHRIVAETFIPNVYSKPQVNHIDGNKQNNHYSNLEWVTCRENVMHSIKMNPNVIKGINYWNQVLKPKKVAQLSLNGELIEIYRNCKDASRATGVCSRNIHQVADKTEYKPGLTRSQAGGFKWEFIE